MTRPIFSLLRRWAPICPGTAVHANRARNANIRTTVLSAKENVEYEVICNNLSFDKVNQKWSTSYPFVTSLSILQNNYGQAVARMRSLEAKLIKQNQLTEFNEAFKDIVDCSVFQELSPQDIDA